MKMCTRVQAYTVIEVITKSVCSVWSEIVVDSRFGL